MNEDVCRSCGHEDDHIDPADGCATCNREFGPCTGYDYLPGCTFCGGEGHEATAHDQSEVW